MNHVASDTARLAAEQSRIEAEIATTAFHHYPVFIQAQRAADKISASAERCASVAATASADLAGLQDATSSLIAMGQRWRSERAKAAAASSQLSRIVDLLEAPSTVEQCLRNDMTSDALLVVDHVNAMAHAAQVAAAAAAANGDELSAAQKPSSAVGDGNSPTQPKQSPTSPSATAATTGGMSGASSAFITEIAEATNMELQHLAATVIVPRLATPGLSLPLALRLTNFLRRVGVPERFLCQSFLSLRLMPIESLLAEAEAVSAGAPYILLQKLLTTYKVHVTEAVATFHACFLSSSSSSSPPSAANQDEEEDEDDMGSGGLSADELLSAWVSDRCSALLHRFSECIVNVSSGTELAALAEQVAQCGGALAKVGADVSSLMRQMVADRVVAIFAMHCESAVQSFCLALGSHSWATSPTSADDVLSSRATTARKKGEDGGSEDEQEDENKAPKATGSSSNNFVPPMVLLQFLPLAYIANGVAAACNEVRKCSAVSAWPSCRAVATSVIQSVVQALVNSREWLMLEGQERKAQEVFGLVAAEECLPFVCRCVDAIFRKDSLKSGLPELVKPLMLSV